MTRTEAKVVCRILQQLPLSFRAIEAVVNPPNSATDTFVELCGFEDPTIGELVDVLVERMTKHFNLE